MFTQFRPDFLKIFYEAKARFFFQLWVARLFILFTKTARPESIGCPQNKPGNKRNKLLNGWCQYNGEQLWTKYIVSRIFGIFFLVDFLISSLITPNVLVVMVLKCRYKY